MEECGFKPKGLARLAAAAYKMESGLLGECTAGRDTLLALIKEIALESRIGAGE